MRNLLVGLFWLWLLVSLGIYAVRVWRRMTQGPKSESQDESPTSLDARGLDAGIPIVSPSSGLGARPASTLSPQPSPKPPSPDPGPRSSDPAAGTGASVRSGLFAPTSTPATTTVGTESESVTEARPTVAELVAGITMPCDLAPIVGSDRFLDPYHVAFSTGTAPAATVGGGVADELERLGFALRSTAENRLVATKEGRQLTVTIYPDAADVTFGDGKAYPTVPPGSVVVEFTS